MNDENNKWCTRNKTGERRKGNSIETVEAKERGKENEGKERSNR